MRAALAFAVTLFAFALIAPQHSQAAPLRFLNIRHVEADENKPYWLTEENGPWCILAS